MINKKEQRFFAELAISSPPQRVNFVKPRSLVRTSRALVPNVPIIIPKNNVDKSLIHVCFALYDGTKTYSRFTGTAILSLFENTKSKVMIHLLHDNTLTEDNREKLMQIVERYGQQLKFYNVEELCADGLVKIEEQFPKVKASNFSIATFYRFFIPDLLLPQGIEKAIYLDSDIVVNLDIAEFWQIELGDKPLGVVPEIDNGVPVKEVALFVTEGVIAEEIYFNAGILLMNLKVLHNEEAKLAAGTKFVSEYPRIVCFDQDVLNYCFAASALKLPIRFNFYVLHARRRREFNVDKKLCHYAAGKWSFIMDTNDPFYQLFMKYFIKTPWVDSDTAAILLGKGLPSRKYHAVSVVIPMYNAEKYINECLDSLLIQTFQDFEVIVVDDCSTDDSVKIVKEYAPKFHGRLKLEKTEKNSGGGGHVPRNMGMLLARGDYLYFMDADDMILSTALETFYMAAILYDAEVVYSSSWYFLRAPNDIYLNKDGVNSKMRGIQTEFVMDDPNKNLSRLLLEGSSTAPLTKLASSGNDLAAWTKFVRRDFILRNKIFFANIPTSGDAIRTINMYCHARRFLRISTPLYIHRIYNDNSITRMARTPQEQCKFWFSSFMNFAKVLYELEKENKFLAENPFYGLAALSIHLIRTFKLTEDSRRELGNEELYKVLHSSFSQGFPNSSTLLLMFLFSILSDKESNVRYLELINNKFSLYFTAKIYVRINKKMNEETIQILSLSDKKARISKPKWWQKEGTCHIIDSYKGELDIVAKAIVEGNVQIRLGGPFVLNPEDKSKRIPYWIDFTKLIVNDKLILDTPTPTWNNKPYVYNITDVKAGEEIKFHIEWLPHRSDAIESQFIAPPPKPEPKAVTPAPPKVKNPIPRNFMPFITARMEVKLLSKEGDFQILSVSDSNARITKPEYLQKGSTCYCIHTTTGKIKMITKSSVDGQVRLLLRSMDIRDPKDNTKRIPYWLDYKNLVINGKKIFDTSAPICYDKFFGYNVDVKANEETEVEVEWLPHRSDATSSKKLLSQPLEEKILRNFMPFITARMEVKLMSKEGDFQMLSVSDSNARITKPEYLQKGSTCYCIHTTTGKIKMITKSSVDGQVRLLLRSMDIRDPKDNTKRIPYWLDYKNLVINGKKIFDTSAPICYDKFFGYNVDVKANEETEVEVEWLPHRSDTP